MSNTVTVGLSEDFSKVILYAGINKINYVIMRWFFIFCFFALSACNKGRTRSQSGWDRDPSNRSPSNPVHGVHKCKADFISSKSQDCVYHLPHLEEGETFTSQYIETLNVSTKGITLGQGKWVCRGGIWQVLDPPLCITCLPGLSREQCIIKWESLYNQAKD